MWNETSRPDAPGSAAGSSDAGDVVELEAPAESHPGDVRPSSAQRELPAVPQQSPLSGVAALMEALPAGRAQAFHLRELAFRDLVLLRGDAGDPAFVAAVRAVTGCTLPVRANTTSVGSGYDALWLGPDEWMIRSHAACGVGETTLAARLTDALRGQFASAVAVGSGYTMVALGGTLAADVVARGCPLDLHPRMFGPGQCAQSYFFAADIVLIPVAANAASLAPHGVADAFTIVVRRSFADYFCRMMLDAAAPLLLG